LFPLSAALVLVAGETVSAHRLDEYLQAARIDLQADRVTVDLELTQALPLRNQLSPRSTAIRTA
jgi:hypothetical protein